MPVVYIYAFKDEAALNSGNLDRGVFVGKTEDPASINGILTSFSGYLDSFFGFYSQRRRLESIDEAIRLLGGEDNPSFSITLDDLELL